MLRLYTARAVLNYKMRSGVMVQSAAGIFSGKLHEQDPHEAAFVSQKMSYLKGH